MASAETDTDLHRDFLALLLQRNAEPTRLPTLFHGTTRERAERVLAEGLLPRAATGMATQQTAYGAHTWLDLESGCVYLTDCQAAMFAVNSARAHGGSPAVVEARLDGASRERLLPDEDVLAAGMVACEGLRKGPEEQAAARASMRGLRRLWPASLAYVGKVAHDGSVAAIAARAADLAREDLDCLSVALRAMGMWDEQNGAAFGIGPSERAFYEGTSAWAAGEDVRPWDCVHGYGSLPHAFRRRLRAAFETPWLPI